MFIIKFIFEDSDSCNSTFKQLGKWHSYRYLIYIDRLLGIFGSIVFTLSYSFGIVIFPIILFIMIFADWNSYIDYFGYVALFFVICLQTLMAYLREGFFYDSCATVAALGFLIGIYFIILSVVAMAKFGMILHTIAVITLIQGTMLTFACGNA